MWVVMFSHFIGKLLQVGSLAYGALVLGTCPPLAADIVNRVKNTESLWSLEGLGNCYAQVSMHMLMSAFLRDSRGSGSTSTRVTMKGLPSLAFCYVQFWSCTSACSELMLVNLCSWRCPVIHRCWDPSLFVIVSVPGGRRNFLHAHQCTCRSHHSFMPVGSCQALVLGHQSGVSIPGHFIGVLVHWYQGML